MPNAPAPQRTEPRLGVADVLLAYLLLALGFGLIGFASQQADIVVGLWITEALAIALPALIWIRASGASIPSYLGLRMPRARWFAIAAVTALLNQPVVSLLTWIAQSALPHSLVELFENKNAGLDAFFSAHPLSMLAAVAIAAPIGEEIFFRGFALPASARSMRPLFAAILTAALFSLMHVDAVGALGLFEIGLWLAVLRWGSGSLLPAMLGHALNNAIAGTWFLLGLQSTGREPPGWAISLGIDNPDAPPPLWVLIGGSILTLAGLALAWRVLSRPTPQLEKTARPTPQIEKLSPELVGESQADETKPSLPLRHRRAWPLWTIWFVAAIAGAAQLAHAH